LDEEKRKGPNRIGNSDAHGKNISFIVGQAGIDVAPSCDLLNIDIYEDEFERDLTMAVGDGFVAGKVMPYALAEFCAACQLPLRQVATSLKNLCTATKGRMGSLPLDDVRSGEAMDFAQELIERIKGNAERFLAMAGELPHVRL
jgi:serine/threonine-protein kinase HipA